MSDKFIGFEVERVTYGSYKKNYRLMRYFVNEYGTYMGEKIAEFGSDSKGFKKKDAIEQAMEIMVENGYDPSEHKLLYSGVKKYELIPINP